MNTVLKKRLIIAFVAVIFCGLTDAQTDEKQKTFEWVFGEYAKFDPAMVEKVLNDVHGKRHYVDKDGDGKPEEVWYIDISPRHNADKRPLLVRVVDRNGNLRMGEEPDYAGYLYLADWNADGTVDTAIEYEDTDGDGDIDQMAIFWYNNDRLCTWWGRDDGDDRLREKLLALTNDNKWEKVAEIPLKFNGFHTQGMVKAGDYFYLSSVEVIRGTKRFEKPQGKLDRDEGEGKGHLFKFDREGNLLHDLTLGEGAAYHPGGIDYDGTYIWVPVAEYRPYSLSIIYKVDPVTMKAEEVFRYNDHIGAIVHNTDDHTLVGATWDARELHHWTCDDQGKITNAHISPETLGVNRKSYYVAFQDCKYIGGHMMFCSGVRSFRNETGSLRLGGWEILDLRDNRPVLQIPVTLLSPSGAVITGNPCTVEPTGNGVRAYFVPDDNEKSTLLVYEIAETIHDGDIIIDNGKRRDNTNKK